MAHYKALSLTYLVALLAAAAAAVVTLIYSPHFETNILSLLPSIYRDPVLEMTITSQAQRIENKVAIVVRSPSSRDAEACAVKVAQEMRQSGLFSKVDERFSALQLTPLREFFLQYPFQLTDPLVAPSSEASAESFVSEVQGRAFSPEGLEWLRTIDRDPLLLFPMYLQSATGNSGRFIVKNGFIHVDEPSSSNVLITAQISGSAFQRATQEAILRFFNERPSYPSSSLLISGIVFFAEDAARRTQGEVSWISSITIAILILFLLWVFRSLRALVLIVGSISTSFLGALYLTQISLQYWAHHGIHLITLGFGSSLLGVSVDYALHYIVAHRTSDQTSNTPTLGRVGSGLILGFLTTIIGFIGIAISPFPGLQELAIFCCIGLVLSLFSVFLLFPSLAGPPLQDARLLKLAYAAKRLNSATIRRFIFVALFILAVTGLWRVTILDDIRALSTPSRKLLATQQETARLIGFSAGVSLLVVKGSSEEEVLQREEALHTKLHNLVESNRLESYRAVSMIVPSQKRQRERHAAFATLLRSAPTIFEQLIASLHLPPPSVQVLAALTNSPATGLATMDQCLRSGACDIVKDLWVGEIKDQFTSTISLLGFKGGLSDELSGIRGVTLVNQADSITNALRLYRHSAIVSIPIFYGVIFLILSLRYGIRRTIVIFSPSILGAVAALSTLGLAGVPINVFSVFALMVLLGVSIDYSIFFAEDTHNSPSTGLAVTLSAITTVLSFGMLSWSSTPALQSFGIVLSVGVLVAALLAPLVQKTKAGE